MFLTLRGHVPGKKNAWTRSAKGGMHLPAGVKAEIDGLILQAKSQRPERPINIATVSATFFVSNFKSDLDGKLTTLLDVLVKASVLRNDSMAHVQALKAYMVLNVPFGDKTDIEVRDIE